MASELKQLDVAVDQSWDHHLRIDRPVCGGKLVAFFQVQKTILPHDALQVQRDAYAETRLRAVVGVKLHILPRLLHSDLGGWHK
jgi:hypothetical protein